VRDLLAVPVDDGREHAHGGLTPMAICRAERLISEAMDSPSSASPRPIWLRSFRQART
jgi:hypothetical protein